MNTKNLVNTSKEWIQLLRWNKPSGRLILLIPAGWALWLTPNNPPETSLIALIVVGGLAVSGAGCIANDLWDRFIDRQVQRTMNRPLAKGTIQISTAIMLLIFMLLISLFVISYLPIENRSLCFHLSLITLPLILIYPSAKRWFSFPQGILALCWGFAVLIPWAASEGNLNGGLSLLGCWFATIFWTFGFDTVYAMADIEDDKLLGLKSSAITLSSNASFVVSLSYAMACISLAIASLNSQLSWLFWPCWFIASLGMQLQTLRLKRIHFKDNIYGIHFKNQVRLGSLLLLGIVLGRLI